MTRTGITVVDAIFAHIPRPLAFITEILDSCVRTTNNSPLETYDNVRIALDSYADSGRYCSFLLFDILPLLSSDEWDVYVKDHCRLRYIGSEAPDANGSSHGCYSRSFGYNATGDITASTCRDVPQTEVGEIKNTLFHSYARTLVLRHFPLDLCHNVCTGRYWSRGDSKNSRDLFLLSTVSQYDSSFTRA